LAVIRHRKIYSSVTHMTVTINVERVAK